MLTEKSDVCEALMQSARARAHTHTHTHTNTDVLNGDSDAAFTRTDAIESYTQKNPEKGAKLKILR